VEGAGLLKSLGELLVECFGDPVVDLVFQPVNERLHHGVLVVAA
jgi:hypothetical protein